MAKTKLNTETENGGKSSPAESATASSSSSGPTPVVPPDNDNISTRVGTRTKKAKVVFDPSDNYVPRKRVRKNDLPQPESPVVSSSAKLEAVVPKSPAKPDGLSDNSNGNVAKPRLALSPTIATKQTTGPATYRPKVLGSGPSTEAARLAGTAGGSLEPASARKQEFKREPNCDMCHKVEQQRRGFKLIDCSNCAFRAHSKCLRAHPVYQKFPIRLNFRCFQCIECVVCGKSLRGGNLLFCCDCQNAFHANCHGPSASSGSNSGNSPWACKRCSGERSPAKQSRSQEKPAVAERPESEDNADDEAHQEFAGFSDNEIRKDSFSLSDSAPVNDSAIQPDEDEDNDDDDDDDNDDGEEAADDEPDQVEDTVEDNDEEKEEKFDPRLDNFEDIQNWTCEDVYQYFKHYFPDYAHLFKEQEIDGPSLILMRKSDILSGFGLKLGPAISLYQRIVMMQNNDRDFRLTWI